MLLIKYSVIIILVLLVLIPISIYLMARRKHNFKNQRKMVKNQYPSMFHRTHMDDNTMEGHDSSSQNTKDAH